MTTPSITMIVKRHGVLLRVTVFAFFVVVGAFAILAPGIASGGDWSRVALGVKRLGAGGMVNIRELRAAKDAVYGLLPDGVLVRIPYDGSELQGIGFPGDTIGFSIDKAGQVWVLVYEGLSHNLFLLTAPKPDPQFSNDEIWNVSTPLHVNAARDYYEEGEYPVELAAGSDAVFVLTNRRISAFQGSSNTWNTKILKDSSGFFGFDNLITLVQNDRWMWIANDGGEFGGQLARIDYRTGKVRVIEDRNTVTGLVNAPGAAGCVLFSSGLAHLFTVEGIIYKSCGGKAVQTWKGKDPIWGLTSTADGLYALSQGRLIPLRNGRPDFADTIKFSSLPKVCLAGVPAFLGSHVLAIYSWARGEVSTAGNTPFAVAVPPGAKLHLKPCMAPEAATKAAPAQ